MAERARRGRVGLGKIYGDGDVPTRALDERHASRSSAGEFAAIVGTSGSGKSTLLNLLGLLDTPTDGTLRLDGPRRRALEQARARAALRNELIGFVFQFHHLLPEFSVCENVLMPALIAGKAARRRRCERAPRRRWRCSGSTGSAARTPTRSPAARSSAWPSGARS